MWAQHKTKHLSYYYFKLGSSLNVYSFFGGGVIFLMIIWIQEFSLKKWSNITEFRNWILLIILFI